MRARIHTLILRIGMPIDGVFDSTQEIGFIETQLRSVSGGERNDLEQRLARIRESRDSGFDFEETAAELPSIIKMLEPMARHTFGNIESVVRNS